MLHIVVATALWMTGASDSGSVTSLGPMEAPPWEMANGETPFPPGMTFSACDNLIASLAFGTLERVVERKYSLSRRWGKILRAKLAMQTDASSITLVTCWGSDRGVETAVKPAGW